MRVRVSFDYKAGVCLWADDAEARARWTSAIDAAELGLPTPLVAEAEALMASWNGAFDREDPGAGLQWSESDEAAFQTRLAAWVESVRPALALGGVELAVERLDGLRFSGETFVDPVEELAQQESASDSSPLLEGEVVACFANEDARGSAAAKFLSDYTWQETATWACNGLGFRERERTPAELLAALEAEPGFVAGWWQGREGGPDLMLAGDPVEHAVACLRARNATGLANFLSWQRVQRVHLGEPLAAELWAPTKQHRLARKEGSFWEWWSFLRNATSALKGRGASEGYKNAERDRLIWRWTQGGSRSGWPATFGEAFERIDLRRENFVRWAK